MAGGDRFTRGTFLKKTGAASAAALGGSLWASSPAPARGHRRQPPIRNLVISCQENRSFDHYFGYAPQVQAKGFGPPRGYSQPDGSGGRKVPYELTQLSTADPAHSWSAVHQQYDGGKMDGFYVSSGEVAIGYYTARELPFYYDLFRSSGLCANYFCSLLGPTWPNRFYLMSGTSGGITTNGLWGYGIFDSGRWPIILDLLDDAGVTWKIYNLGGIDDVPSGESDNVAVFWSRWAHDPRTTASQDDYVRDCRTGKLPQVSWLIPSYTNGLDEHPPADVTVGMRLQQEMITALRKSPLAALGIPAHLRRARRLLRPRPAAPSRRLRPRHPRAAVGHLAVRPPRRRHIARAGRACLDSEVDRTTARTADARLPQPQLRRHDTDGREL